MNGRRVVVTGMGMLSPLGLSVEESWQGILAGKSGIATIDHFDASKFATQFCGRVKGFEPTDYFDAKDTKKMDPFIQYGIAAAIQAFEDSGLTVTEDNAARIGCSIGSGIGGLHTIETNHSALVDKGPRRISPFFVPGAIINMTAGNLAIRYGFRGPNIAITTACTTGTHSMGYAARTIAYGDADVMIAGGAEYASTPLGMGGFAAARALSTRNDDPQAASRPWDKDRDGFVLSDGAGIMVLEEYEHAKARGAKIYAELTGFGMSDDAYHMTSPPADGSGAALSMKNAMADAKLNPIDVNYINAHGTSTPAGDIAETMAAKSLYGADANKVVMSSTKSMTGHLLGAAGAIEAIFSVLAIRDQVAPPTINLDNPSDECDLNYVAHTAQEMKIEHALSNSFGFGGTNGTVIFSKV
ncbi:beta-ketoacyl-ACP synthase II [Salinibius halmophilus]|uniref:beta-ketoacyl-ACP synthase II n=1 Tax=Salinibius halmophilus TaxID=1853216 RepID=UPI000E668FF2|nr:beta-ketoacyl-ACP synthase II [Salinibius halmophilus]